MKSILLSPQSKVKQLKKLDSFLSSYPQNQRSTKFEQLIAESFSGIMHLPFFACDNEDTGVQHRVTWQGCLCSSSKAPPNNPDAIAYGYGHCFTIEATLSTGVNQWTREFASAIRHCENLRDQLKLKSHDVSALLVCKDLFRDTYRSIKSNPNQECKLIPLEVSSLICVMETVAIAFTMSHLVLHDLFNKIINCLRATSSLEDFRREVNQSLTQWRTQLLQTEKNVFVGLRSYRAMNRAGKTSLSGGEILGCLMKDPLVQRYFKVIADKPTISDIERSIIEQGFGVKVGQTISGDEPILEPVHFEDYMARGAKLIEAIVR